VRGYPDFMATKDTSGRRKSKGTASKHGSAKRKICDACGTVNGPRATACSKCGKTRFAPSWVRELRRINRSFAVQVTDPHPSAESDDPRLTLHKWWPGNNASFNINTPAQSEAVKTIVDTDLAQFLGWQTARAVKKELKARNDEGAELDGKIREITAKNPRLLAEIVKGIKPEQISDEDVPQLGEALGETNRPPARWAGRPYCGD
jgi:ribosomal protein L40E